MSGAAWLEANQAYLAAALAEIRARVRGGNGTGEAARALETARAALPAPPAIDAIAAAFGLTSFERGVLLLAAAAELDDGRGEGSVPVPTFGLALAKLPDPHWSALSPSGPLRHWRLVEPAHADPLVGSPLRIDERVLHALTGVHHLDARLEPVLRAVDPPDTLMPTHARVAEQVVRAWRAPAEESGRIELSGTDAGAARDIAAHAAHVTGRRLWRMRGEDAPADATGRDALLRLWHREVVLSGGILLIDTHAGGASAAVCTLIEELEGRAAITAAEPIPGPGHMLRIAVPEPTAAERLAFWRGLHGDAAEATDELAAVSTQFRLGVDGVRAAARRSAAGSGAWEAAREQARRGMEGLAQRIEPAAGWDDLVLPAAQLDILRQIAASARRRTTVFDDWGFAARGARGLGIGVLFAGPSGTGKTMAAEVLATELRLDLHRIDLSQVVSKYIGETEKNLARVFDAAEQGGAVLLFDEADALFGRRSEVRDSHDRYANIEVSYLLQRMESYHGLAILTTNAKAALDPAFLRRLRYVVQFPFPDADARRAIWQRVFPEATPRDGLDPARLARLDITGGSIRNIAINAAFLAACDEQPVCMAHVLRAARAEYAKLEKPLTGAEVAGWT